jgi:hypothetical protein
LFVPINLFSVNTYQDVAAPGETEAESYDTWDDLLDHGKRSLNVSCGYDESFTVIFFLLLVEWNVGCLEVSVCELVVREKGEGC